MSTSQDYLPAPMVTVRSKIAGDLNAVLLGVVMASIPFSPSVYFGFSIGLASLSGIVGLLNGGRFFRADFFVLAYAALSAASYLWTENDEATLFEILYVGGCVLLFLASRLTLRRGRDLIVSAVSFLVGSTVIGLQLVITSGASIRLTYDTSDARYSLESVNANYSAYTFATASFVAILLFLRFKSPLARSLLALDVLFMYICILLNGTRGALLSLALLVGWAALAFIGKRLALRTVVVISGGTALLAFVGVLDGIVRTFVPATGREAGNLSGRLEAWPVARDVFWQNPFFGHGVGYFRVAPENYLHFAAHQALLDVGVGIGFVGVALFVGLIVFSLRDQPPVGLALLSSGAFVAVMGPILISGYWHSSPVFWASLALASRSFLLCREKVDPEPAQV